MVRILLSLVCLCLPLICLGCSESSIGSEKPIWADTKLSDLAPAKPAGQGNTKPSTINLQILIFEIPSQNVDKLDEISKYLTIQPYRFRRYSIFTSNGFITGFSRITEGNQVLKLLETAQARKAASFNFILESDQSDYVPVLNLPAAKEIFYTNVEGKTDSVTIGPGRLSLRITAQKSPAFRGTFIVSAAPAVPSAAAGASSQMKSLAKLNDVIFDSCSFSLPFSPGDFFFLRPIKYTEHGNSLGSLFFSRPGIRPVVLAFLVVCADIKE
jgi:hypothetical protein